MSIWDPLMWRLHWNMQGRSIAWNFVEFSVDNEDGTLDRERDLTEISRCIRKLKNNRSSGYDLVGD